jgi:hypothetical protein
LRTVCGDNLANAERHIHVQFIYRDVDRIYTVSEQNKPSLIMYGPLSFLN